MQHALRQNDLIIPQKVYNNKKEQGNALIQEQISKEIKKINKRIVLNQVIPINNNMLVKVIGEVNQKPPPSYARLECILLWNNGKPIQISQLYLRKIIKSINNINRSDPYFYSIDNGQIYFSFKIRYDILQNQEKILKCILPKVQKSTQCVQQLFYFHGITKSYDFRNNINKSQKLSIVKFKLQAIKVGLKCKKQIVEVIKTNLKKQENIVKSNNNQTQQNKNVKNVCNNNQEIPQMLNQQVQQSKLKQGQTIYQYYDQIKIQEKQSILKYDPNDYQNNYKENSNKYQISRNYFLMKKNTNCAETQSRKLIMKSIREDKDDKKYYRIFHKLQRQKDIIKNIRYDNRYFVKYFFKSQKKSQLHNYFQKFQDQSCLVMEDFPTTLNLWLKTGSYSLSQVFQRFKQIVEGVSVLHRSGIVHRDLKPQNILIDTNFHQSSKPKIRIIDFSDSALVTQPYSIQLANFLGQSIPYSPFECGFACDFGINNPAIDVWSLGMIIHEMFYKRMPCLYSRNIKMQEFISGIQNVELEITLSKPHHRHTCLGYMQQCVNLLISNCLTLKQIQRLKITQIQSISQQILNMSNNFDQLITKYQNSFKNRINNQQNVCL